MGLVLQLLFLVGTASLLQAGCPLVPAITDFDPDRFEGDWYHVEWLDTGLFSQVVNKSSRCRTVSYRHEGNGSFTATVNWKATRRGVYVLPRTVTGSLTRVDPNFPNYFDTNSLRWLPTSAPPGRMYVLDTDYTRYAILYTCTDFGFGITEMGWIIHRNIRGFTVRKRTRVLTELKDNLGIRFINTAMFMDTKTDDCFGTVGNFTSSAP
ncbi:apolipoprotein D-like [Ylistrum balloti]|uniref:apolipoprotein D-like n=1 Tax=Ylistrum balloti TaxID=509963 RepID=UPI002905B4D4|nr:apolipoprotein D-like [Ylistrum balloti]